MIKLLSLSTAFVDDVPVGSIVHHLAKHPALADEVHAALLQREAALADDHAGDLQRQLESARDELKRLTAPLPKYYLVVPLDAPAGAATHAGIRQPPASEGGAWLYDLLAEASGRIDAYVLVKSGLKAPTADKVTSLSELTATQASSDIAAALASTKAQKK